MGSGSKTLSRKKKYLEDESDSDYSSSSSDPDSETSSERRNRRRKQRESKHKRSSSSKGSRREREKSERHRKSKERRSRKEKKVREDKHGSRRRKRSVDKESDGSGVSDEEKNPKSIVGGILNKFPEVVEELKQLLEMIDRGQAVDIRGISDRFLVKQLKKLFRSLRLKESDGGIYLLPQNRSCTMEVIGPMISSHLSSREQQQPSHIESSQPVQPVDSGQTTVQPVDSGQTTDQADGIQLTESTIKDESSAPRRRVMGPEMPSSELLAAAAKLTEAEAELREAELEIDDGLFIGPAPPAVAAEAASANEAERFEEVTRIMGAEVDSPYDVLGVNHKMPADNMKKRYWKLSLMVHPDKCSHPQAHQAFVILNKAFKTLQDPDKRKAMDEKIKLKEEQEAFKAELQEMRKAAQWRRLQGISMEGDDELLAESETKGPPKREEWMTTLPPERRPDIVSMHSVTSFSKTAKEGRGDTSVWTDTPADKAQKAKMSYLEAYNEAAALASNEDNKRTSSDAALVDQYNRTKRSKSLVEKHQEEKIGRSKKKSKGEKKKEEWEGQHPWKPWDREKDLTAGRQKVNLDPENMMKGLTSRFSSGNIQRNFL